MLVHGVRKPGGSVHHMKLHAFRTRQALEPGQWERFQREMQDKHPLLRFDWPRLLEQGRKLAAVEPPPEPASLEQHVLKVRRAIKALQGELRGLGPLEAGSVDREVLLRSCHDLRDVVYYGATLIETGWGLTPRPTTGSSPIGGIRRSSPTRRWTRSGPRKRGARETGRPASNSFSRLRSACHLLRTLSTVRASAAWRTTI